MAVLNKTRQVLNSIELMISLIFEFDEISKTSYNINERRQLSSLNKARQHVVILTSTLGRFQEM